MSRFETGLIFINNYMFLKENKLSGKYINLTNN